MQAIDTLFVNGKILTMNGRLRAEAVAVAGGKVAAVGKESDFAAARSTATEVVDLEGRAMLPGFEDAHAHIWKL